MVQGMGVVMVLVRPDDIARGIKLFNNAACGTAVGKRVARSAQIVV